jgi:hypothetical protein
VPWQTGAHLRREASAPPDCQIPTPANLSFTRRSLLTYSAAGVSSSILTETGSLNGACGVTARRIWSAKAARGPGGGSRWAGRAEQNARAQQGDKRGNQLAVAHPVQGLPDGDRTGLASAEQRCQRGEVGVGPERPAYVPGPLLGGGLPGA